MFIITLINIVVHVCADINYKRLYMEYILMIVVEMETI